MTSPVDQKHDGIESKMASTAKNVVHLSTSCQMIVLNYFKNVLNDYSHQNCPNFPGSMPTSGLPNSYQYAFIGRFYDLFFDKRFL